MSGFKAGDFILYNDGREGHTDVKAEVLWADDRRMLVQFEDRADTTTIYFTDSTWMEHIRLA